MPVLVDHEGEETQDASALDRDGETALVLRASARDAPRHNLGPVADKILEEGGILVINGLDPPRAKLAHLPARTSHFGDG